MTGAGPSGGSPAPRIVSLLASATEIVYALGFGGHLVGRSHECDHPPEVSALPMVTEPCFDTDRPSGEIDRQVKDRLQRALSLGRASSRSAPIRSPASGPTSGGSPRRSMPRSAARRWSAA